MFEAPRQIRPVAVGAGDVGIGFAPLAQIDFGKILCDAVARQADDRRLRR